MKRHLSFLAALGVCFFACVTAAYAQQIKADTGGIAIGGSVTSSERDAAQKQSAEAPVRSERAGDV